MFPFTENETLHISLMGANRNFYKLQGFFLKSDEICVEIILKRNFKLPAIFSVVTSSGHKMKHSRTTLAQ